MEAQDRVAAGVAGPVSRRDLWVGVWCGVCCVGPHSPEWVVSSLSGVGGRSRALCVSITYRPVEGACFCGPVSGAYRGTVRTGRWGRSATGELELGRAFTRPYISALRARGGLCKQDQRAWNGQGAAVA